MATENAIDHEEIDQEKAAHIRQLLAEENEQAVAKHYGEQELNSAEFDEAQKDLGNRRSAESARMQEAMAETEEVERREQQMQAERERREQLEREQTEREVQEQQHQEEIHARESDNRARSEDGRGPGAAEQDSHDVARTGEEQEVSELEHGQADTRTEQSRDSSRARDSDSQRNRQQPVRGDEHRGRGASSRDGAEDEGRGAAEDSGRDGSSRQVQDDSDRANAMFKASAQRRRERGQGLSR